MRLFGYRQAVGTRAHGVSVLSFSFSRFLIRELHVGKLSETVIVHGNAPHNRRRTTPSIAVFWTNLRFFGQPMVMVQKSDAAICALMSTRAKLAVSALSVLPPNQELPL